MVGSERTRLVVLRGNSASGKSTVARRLRDRLGRGVAWVEQDHFRRIVLREHDRPGMPNIGLIDNTARYALDAGYHVILEGILSRSHYGQMLARLADDHRGITRHVWFDIDVEETLRRHAGKPLAAEVSAERVRSWYRGSDLLGVAGELIIGQDETVEQIVDRVLDAADFGAPPVLDRYTAADHL